MFHIAEDIDDARSSDHILLPYDLPPTAYKKGGKMSLSLSLFIILCMPTLFIKVQLGGSVVECWTRDQGVVGSRLKGGTALCP